MLKLERASVIYVTLVLALINIVHSYWRIDYTTIRAFLNLWKYSNLPVCILNYKYNIKFIFVHQFVEKWWKLYCQQYKWLMWLGKLFSKIQDFAEKPIMKIRIFEYRQGSQIWLSHLSVILENIFLHLLSFCGPNQLNYNHFFADSEMLLLKGSGYGQTEMVVEIVIKSGLHYTW